jgi:hypothetical protein
MSQNDSSNNAAGNDFPDYLCIDPDGRTTAWINTNMQFESLGQIKFCIGADRANVRFVDINGDVNTGESLLTYSILTPNRAETIIFGLTSLRARTKCDRRKALETRLTMEAAMFIGMAGVFWVVVGI